MARLRDQLAYVPAAELASRIRRRELSPVEVLEAFIEGIEARNASLNALVYLGFDDAREAAREAERAVRSGDPLGPLHGVPTAIKDLFDFKPGWPSTFGGVRVFKDNRVDFYCPFAERIEKKGGAVILGKTNSPIMGFRGTCDNYLFGPTRNPFDTRKNSGGSSGGSAAAVADGILPFAEGTDGGGSIRIPSSWCGVFGYKPSFGRVPMVLRPNAFSGVNPFIFEGPIARTVEDATLAMNALSGYDPRDPFSLDENIDFTTALRRSIKGLRIAYTPNWDIFPVDPRVKAVVEKAARLFENAGAHVEEVKIGIQEDQMELGDLWCRLIMPLNIQTFESFKAGGLDLLKDHRKDFPPEYLRWVDEGYTYTALDVERHRQVVSRIYDATQAVFSKYDLIVSPTVSCLPVDNAEDGNTKGPSEIQGVEVNSLIGWCMTYFQNYTGHPAASIPAGMAEGRYPVGMQIVGRRYGDLDVLAASSIFERLQPWHHTYEICRARPL